MKMTPKEFWHYARNLEKNMKAAKNKEIAVGLPASSLATRQIYKAGDKTVLDIGMIHEYGLGDNPIRSFLRVPFSIKKKEIEKSIDVSFKKISDGANVIDQLERNGAFITNISKKAFTNKGYGTWDDLSGATVKHNGASAILTDTGTLKQSITYVVRDAT
jgi:hypothetical protein